MEQSKPGSHVFASSLTEGKHKARELYMITLRNHVPRSYMRWLPVTLRVPDMIIV